MVWVSLGEADKAAYWIRRDEKFKKCVQAAFS